MRRIVIAGRWRRRAFDGQCFRFPAQPAALDLAHVEPVLDQHLFGEIEGSWLRWEAEALPVEGAPPPAGDHDAADHGDGE